MKPPHLEWPIFRRIRWILEIGVGITLLGVFIYVVVLQQFETFAKAITPILATYIATASLFYNRGRSLRKGPSKNRSLYAAERSLQATLFTLIAIILGGSIFGCTQWFGLHISKEPSLTNLWIFVYFIPMAFIQFGYASFLFGLRVISKELLRPTTPRELAKRIKGAP